MVQFKIKRVLLLAASVSALTCGVAQAGGFALREQSAAGQGSSFAGAAAGGAGLGSMFWNPAAMTQYSGMQSYYTFTAIAPNSNITANSSSPTYGFGPTSGDIGRSAVLPASATSYQFNDRLWFGLSVNSPHGLVTKAPLNWSGQVYARTSKIFSTNVNPNVALKVNDWISVAAGLQVEYFKTSLKSAFALPTAGSVLPNAPTLTLAGDGIGYGFTAGVLLTPVKGLDLGVGYRSRMTIGLSGDVKNFPFVPIGLAGTNIDADVKLPDSLTIGARYQVTKDLTLLAGYEWTNWSLFSSFPVVSTGPIASGQQLTTLAFGWRDGWFSSVGAEYKWNQQLTLRTGIAYESSPVTLATRGLRLPDADRIWTSVGLSYQITPKMNVDVGYTHIFAKDSQIALVAGNPTFNGVPYLATAKGSVDIVSVGLRYSLFDKSPVRARY